MNKKKISLLIVILLLLAASGLAGCQTESETPSTQSETRPTQSGQQSQSNLQDTPDSPASSPEGTLAEPVSIEAGWQASPHADTYVLDAGGTNNSCARCHAPVNWLPTIDEIPESCFACKFEIENPPLFIPENDWTDIPCNVCHKVDKKDNVQPEYVWLAFAAIEEYAPVASPTELCMKCHAPVEIPGHVSVELGGAHADYECTGCHAAHSITTSCGAAGCHEGVIEPIIPIAGHDENHQAVSCEACHDGSGMEVGPDAETGLWTTFTSESTATSGDKFAFTSHNVVLEASCDRCHYVNNPWTLSDSIESP